jgi:hypothetical protein
MAWALDNWLYIHLQPVPPAHRARRHGSLREETDPNGGQWWSRQDNYGKLWWSTAAARSGPSTSRRPSHLRRVQRPRQLRAGLPGAMARAGRHRRHAGRHEPRAHARSDTESLHVGLRRRDLPRPPPAADMVGDLLFGEPVGRIVRRAKVVVTDGLTQLQNAHPKSEFIRSTDPLFRPVAVHNAPDGTLSSSTCTRASSRTPVHRPGSYLRRKIEQYGSTGSTTGAHLAHHPRERRAGPHASAHVPGDAGELVTHLEHPNGWWRDTAQKLLVLRQDTSVVPALRPWRARRGTSSPGSTRCGRSRGCTRLDAPSCAS